MESRCRLQSTVTASTMAIVVVETVMVASAAASTDGSLGRRVTDDVSGRRSQEER